MESLSDIIEVKKIFDDGRRGEFHIEKLYPGYGITIGNALRRALLSSLPGAGITSIKVEGVSHEFSTIPGVKEDLVEVILNLKRIRFKFVGEEPQILTLNEVGKKKVKAKDLRCPPQVQPINKDFPILTLVDDKAKINMELTVEKGLGYSPASQRPAKKLPIGTILIDAIFSPIEKVNFSVENMRVRERTDYNRLKLEIETDGSLTPTEAFRKVSQILRDHYDRIEQQLTKL